MAYQSFAGGTSGSESEAGTVDAGGDIGTDANFLGGILGDSDSGGSGEFDAAIHIGRDKRNADGSYRKKRGRKTGAGSTARTQRTASAHKASIDGLSRALLIVHLGFAGVFKAPELALDQDEADSFAGATANVLEQFDITPSPKVEAILAWGAVAATVYGPRIYLINQRKKEERKVKLNEQSTGFPFDE